MFVYTVGVGIAIFVLGVSVFWMVPFFGPALILSLLLAGDYIMAKCALSVSLGFYFTGIPVLAGLVVGFGVYNSAGVSLIRDEFFFWPISWLLTMYQIAVTALASAFLIVNGVMFFSMPDHNNPMALMVSQLGPTFGTCTPTDSIIACSSIVGLFIVICFTRSKTFEQFMQSRGFPFFQVREEALLTSRLTSPVSSDSESV